MSLSTIEPKPLTVSEVSSVMRRAALDTDPVSMACNGSSFLDSDHAVLFVRGNVSINKVYAALVREGLVTEGKGIVG